MTQIKVKAKELNENIQGLATIVNSQKELPAQLMLDIARNVKILQREGETVNERLDALAKKYAQLDELGNVKTEEIKETANGVEKTAHKIIFKDDEDRKTEAKYVKEHKELMNAELEIEMLTISMKKIEECQSAEEKNRLNIADIMRLEFLIK